jgi:hypothetical protein
MFRRQPALIAGQEFLILEYPLTLGDFDILAYMPPHLEDASAGRVETTAEAQINDEVVAGFPSDVMEAFMKDQDRYYRNKGISPYKAWETEYTYINNEELIEANFFANGAELDEMWAAITAVTANL